MTILGQLTAGLKAKPGREKRPLVFKWWTNARFSDNWDESSGTGMFLYLTKKSIDQGYIDGTATARGQQRLPRTGAKATANSDGTVDINDCSSIGVQEATVPMSARPNRSVHPRVSARSLLAP